MPVKALFVSPSMAGGGAERVFATLLTHLDRRRFAPTLALAHKTGPLLEALPPDVEVLDLAGGRARKSLTPLIRLVRRLRPNVVFTAQGHMNCIVRLAMPFFPRGTRVVAREANILSRKIAEGSAPSWFGPLYRLLYPGFHAVVCQSQEMLDDMVNNWGLPQSKAVRIPNPVDIRRLRELAAAAPNPFAPGRPQIVAMGRLVRQKGFDLLLQALALTPEPRPLLTILGQGELEGQLRAQARTLHIEIDVCFAGFQNNPYPFLAAADLFVLPSRYEGFPNALLEAMALGTPAVAFACPGGLEEIVLPGVNGWLAPPEDVAALAALLREHQRPGLDAAQVSQSIAARFGLDVILERYATLLSD